MRSVALTLAFGVGIFLATAASASALLNRVVPRAGVLLAEVVGLDLAYGVRFNLLIVSNLLLVAAVTFVPIQLSSWASRRASVHRIGVLAVAALLFGLALPAYTRGLTAVNACVTGIDFPLGGDHLCDES